MRNWNNVFESIETSYVVIFRVKRSKNKCVIEDIVYYIAMMCECVQLLC
jgi:hypothetical protein